ncbi:hypothetical protein A3Q56_07348 [Intoshia linei]|uniref:Uncharacterized protein n=1 Tax=Intoshia linei TaxID=1819745 RepID=A0A177ASG2_9BILA|nr:hypothetical protein A3Q56_07348 [Intoshia linei]
MVNTRIIARNRNQAYFDDIIIFESRIREIFQHCKQNCIKWTCLISLCIISWIFIVLKNIIYSENRLRSILYMLLSKYFILLTIINLCIYCFAIYKKIFPNLVKLNICSAVPTVAETDLVVLAVDFISKIKRNCVLCFEGFNFGNDTCDTASLLKNGITNWGFYISKVKNNGIMSGLYDETPKSLFIDKLRKTNLLSGILVYILHEQII